MPSSIRTLDALGMLDFPAAALQPARISGRDPPGSDVFHRSASPAAQTELAVTSDAAMRFEGEVL